MTIELNPLLVAKHEKFFRLCLQSMPNQAQKEDSNKLALIYFCLQGLELIQKLDFLEEDRQKYSDFIYQHLINTKDQSIQAFRASQTFKLSDESSYDFPNLAATFFGLCNLLALKSNYSQDKRIDNHKIMKFVKKCQVLDGDEENLGSFKPVLNDELKGFGETDLRHCYIAASIRKLVKYDELPPEERINDIDIPKLVQFVKKRINFNGGLSSTAHTESHSGLTFCGLAALKLVGYEFDEPWVEATKHWLVHRQVDYPDLLYQYDEETDIYDDYEYYDPDHIGGFNGRENKLGDTCYSWWVTGSLCILSAADLFDCTKATYFLLNQTQHPLVGGFAPSKGVWPDPFHTFLGLAALALWKHRLHTPVEFECSDVLTDIDEGLVVSQALKQFLASKIKY